MVEMNIPHPITAEIYYSACGKIDRHNRCRQESIDIKFVLGNKYWPKRFNLSVFAINVVGVCLVYQCINRTVDTRADFYNYISEEIIDNTYDRFRIRSAEGGRRTIVDSDDKTFDDDNPPFGRINGAPRCGITLHVTPTKKSRNKIYETETKYLFQGECNVFRKNTKHVCSDCVDTYAVKF